MPLGYRRSAILGGVSANTSGSLIREARRRAGLSQVELGRRAGLTQSVVSVYESGGRQPSLPILERLVRSAGCDLSVTVQGAPTVPAETERPLGTRLSRHGPQVREIVARHRLGNVRVFGRVARGDDTLESDVDLLVDVPPGVGLVGLARCERDLEELLGVRVDLVPADDLKPGVAASALADARPV